MAQTKRKRRSKHRGTAAGTIETRGRTGRPPSPEERRRQTRASAREARLNKPPTWKAAATRGAIAAGGLFVIFAFLLPAISKTKSSTSHQMVTGLLFAVFAFALYTFGGYYLDVFMYRKRQRQKAAQGK
jgi:hypothetical protein